MDKTISIRIPEDEEEKRALRLILNQEQRERFEKWMMENKEDWLLVCGFRKEPVNTGIFARIAKTLTELDCKELSLLWLTQNRNLIGGMEITEGTVKVKVDKTSPDMDNGKSSADN